MAVIDWDENVAGQRDDWGREASSHIRGGLKGIGCRDVMARVPVTDAGVARSDHVCPNPQSLMSLRDGSRIAIDLAFYIAQISTPALIPMRA